MRKIVPFFLVFSLFFASAAHAAPSVDTAGAAILKKQIDDELQWRSDMGKIVGQGLILDGKTEVVPKGGSYEVTLPHLYIIMANQQGKLDVGHISLGIAPGPKSGIWLIQQIALPSSMTLYDAKNAPSDYISVGKQQITATWEPEHGLYSKIDSLFRDIKITAVDKNAPTITIAALKSLVNFKENSDGTWSGPADFGVANVAISVPGKNPVSVSIGKLAFKNIYDHLDMRSTLKMKEEARRALLKGIPQTDQEKRAFLARFLTQEPVEAKGISGTVEASKFLMHDTGSQQQPQRLIGFDQLTVLGLSPDLQQEKNKLMLKAAFQGLHISFFPPALAGLMPHTLNAEITLDNLPLAQITGEFYNFLKKQVSTGATGQQAQDQASAALAQLPKTLESAGTSMSMGNTYAISDAVSMSIASKVNADAKAALGATGKVTVVIKGLDEFVQKVQDTALKAGSDPQMLAYLMGIMTVQTRGQLSKAADGMSIRSYMIDMQKNGDVLLNGAVVKAPESPAPQKP